MNKEGREQDEEVKGLYIGESSRSLYERAKEHTRDKDKREEDSHQVKHWLIDHGEMSSPPKFKVKLLGSYHTQSLAVLNSFV